MEEENKNIIAPKAEDLLDMREIERLTFEKYISVQIHPHENLRIYNYTQKAQFDRLWTPETMACRGLILDGENKIVARPFKKFFNLHEHPITIPDGPMHVTEKMDGSLGILYWIGGVPFIATRGSFTSEQAIAATEMIQSLPDEWGHFSGAYTYLFEIIYPENRIVVDYGKERKLVLLAVIDHETGLDVDDLEIIPEGIERVKIYDGITDVASLKALARDNAEGFVIRFSNGLRLKVKFDEYVRLHRLLTNTNARHIWDALRNNQALDGMIERVPDEFYDWFKGVVDGLNREFYKLENLAYETMCANAYPAKTRKDVALHMQVHCPDLMPIIFSMLDGKPYHETIWKKLKPAAERPFRKDIDA